MIKLNLAYRSLYLPHKDNIYIFKESIGPLAQTDLFCCRVIA